MRALLVSQQPIVEHIPERPRVTHVTVARTEAMVGVAPIQQSTTQLQLFEVDFLPLVAEQLVDKHGRKDADKDPNHRQAEERTQATVQAAMHHLAAGCVVEHELVLSILGRRLRDSRQAHAGSVLGRVVAFVQCLQPVHVHDRGGDCDDHTEKNACEAAAACKLHQVSVSVASLGKAHDHQSRQDKHCSRYVGGNGLKELQGRRVRLQCEVDGDEEHPNKDSRATTHQAEDNILSKPYQPEG